MKYRLHKALEFDGIDDYVDITHSDTFNMKDFTVSIIIFPFTLTNIKTGKNNHYIFKNQYIAIVTHADGTVDVRTVDKNSAMVPLYSVKKITSRKIYSITYTVSVDGIKLYINSELDSTKSFAYPPKPNNNNIYLSSTVAGKSDYNAFARILDVKIYNRALSDSEIKALYKNPFDPIDEDALVLWLSPASIDINAGKWWDLSGKGNHGTIYGAKEVKLIEEEVEIT